VTIADRLLITGAAGRIGRALRDGLRDHVGELWLVDREPLEAEVTNERCVRLDLRDVGAVGGVTAGVDAIVHLGALPGDAPFPTIIDNNVLTTFNVLEEARLAGVRRVVLASSNHATGMYPTSQRTGPHDPPRPDTFYGVGKACDEALASLYADRSHLEVACLRIGSFRGRPRTERELATWLSPRDCVHLVRRCLEAEDLGFAILYGVSANTRRWWDDPEAARIGYDPVDDAETYADEVTADDPYRYQGGPFTVDDPFEHLEADGSR
jgi:uronate dehydrogenase